MKHRALLAAVGGLILVMAACGDSGSSPTAGSSDTTAPPADIEIVTVDFNYDEDAWTIATGPGTSVRLDNEGTLEHNWTIISQFVEDEGELSDDLVLWQIGANAESTVTGTIDVDLAPGTYQIVCTIQGHFSAGMAGELTVTG